MYHGVDLHLTCTCTTSCTCMPLLCLLLQRFLFKKRALDFLAIPHIFTFLQFTFEHGCSQRKTLSIDKGLQSEIWQSFRSYKSSIAKALIRDRGVEFGSHVGVTTIANELCVLPVVHIRRYRKRVDDV